MATIDPFIEQFAVPVAGGSLSVWRAGRPLGSGAPVVIAVHGITANHLAWTPVARALGDDVCLLAPDLRGRGDSSTLPGPYGMSAHVADISALLDWAGLSTVALLGHSMGAYVVALVAKAESDRVRTVLAVDGGIPLQLPAGTDPQVFLADLLGPALSRLTMTFPSHEEYHAFWQSHPAFADGDVLAPDLLAYADHDLGGEPPDLRPRAVEAAVRTDGTELVVDEAIRSALGQVEQPMVLIRAALGLRGEPVPLISAAEAAAFVAALPGRRSTFEIDGLNHYDITLGLRGAAAVAETLRGQLPSG